ncbi:hypothetical protein EVAR_28072_1 [Eumeta japonica]|uniref:Reverse transcriptase domain-containing protein n=1 Tax=Eumeta variegata TaxID=151549 RepID=A0A4C1W9X4_EUMVA|nr:hypothetical protein EVAR_28072_1 [Eumeta japonica]
MPTNFQRNVINVNIKLERKGEEFPIERGVKQGDPLAEAIHSSPSRYLRNIDWADKGILVLNERLTHLRFADDIAMFSRNCNRTRTNVSKPR